jgi:hypothetical protein
LNFETAPPSEQCDVAPIPAARQIDEVAGKRVGSKDGTIEDSTAEVSETWPLQLHSDVASGIPAALRVASFPFISFAAYIDMHPGKNVAPCAQLDCNP